MLWTGWHKWCSWISCHSESYGYCWNKSKRSGISLRITNVASFLLEYRMIVFHLSALSFCLVLRKPFSELLLQFFILVILNSPKEKMLTHRFQKMTKPNSTWKQLLSFSCTDTVVSLLVFLWFIVSLRWLSILDQVWCRCLGRCIM